MSITKFKRGGSSLLRNHCKGGILVNDNYDHGNKDCYDDNEDDDNDEDNY